MKCNLCPRNCGADRDLGELGFCRAGSTAVVGRAAPHYWEEPCICGKGGSGTVFFSGCNLRCVFCQNSRISRTPYGREYTPEGLSELYLDLQSKGVSNINLVTPTPWVPQIKKSLDIAWSKGLYLPVVYNCGGYESIEAIKSLRGYIGVYMPDLKYLDPTLSKKYSSASDYPEVAKRAIYEMVEQRGELVFDSDGMLTKGVIVRHLVLPTHADDSFRVLEYLKREYGDSIIVSIMSQYTPTEGVCPPLNRKVTAEEYASVVKFAKDIGLVNAFIQEGEAASESFIPEFHE